MVATSDRSSSRLLLALLSVLRLTDPPLAGKHNALLISLNRWGRRPAFTHGLAAYLL